VPGLEAPSGAFFSATRAVDLLGRLRESDAILHLLQTLPHMEIPAGRQVELRRVLEGLTGSGHAFVRALMQ